MTPKHLSESLWRLMESIETHQGWTGRSPRFGQDLTLGVMKTPDTQGDFRCYTFEFPCGLLTIQEHGRDTFPNVTEVVVTLDAVLVWKGIFELDLEDEHEWRLVNAHVETCHEGPWVKDMGEAQQRIDLALQASQDYRDAEQALKAQKRLQKRLQKKRST